LSRDYISIVIVCYNEGPLLQRALDSVFAQSNKEFELVVVKNASSCVETLRICRSLEGRANTRVVIRETNEGNAVARNNGFQVARGDILIPMDGDDTLPSHVVATVKESFASHPEADYVFGDYRLITVETDESKIMDCSSLVDDKGWLDGRRFAEGKMFIGASPCRRSTWERVGRYRGSRYGWQDVDFWMRVIASGARGLYVNQVIYEWHRSSKGVNAGTPRFRLMEVNLQNRKFHESFGDWNLLSEAFLNYALIEYDKPEVRRLMWNHGWRMLPCPYVYWSLLIRAWIKCGVPLFISQALVCAKRKLSHKNDIPCKRGAR
jgi:glycosyltransferase involved in cell wall biosynthesis